MPGASDEAGLRRARRRPGTASCGRAGSAPSWSHAVAERLGLAAVEDPGLREIDVGSWSGLTRAEVEERFPEGYARWLGGEIGHDGETREELTARVVSAVERIAAEHPAEKILVVTHGGAIRAIRRHAAGDPGESIENCGTSPLELVDGVLTVA